MLHGQTSPPRAASVSVALVGRFFPATVSVFVAEKKGDSQTDGHTGCLLGLVCVCCHSDCQAAMAEARRRWRLLRDSWSARAAVHSKSLATRAKKNQRGSIWWICEDSGRGPRMHQHEQGRHFNSHNVLKIFICDTGDWRCFVQR